MKKIEDILFIVQGRVNSKRVSQKMIRDFCGTTLFDIAIDKVLDSKIIPKENFYVSVYDIELKNIAKQKNWKHIVVKPTVSGAARHTYNLKNEEIESFQSKWIKLTNGEDFIIQEFQNNVIKKGEIALMIFGGKFSHAILKKAKKGDFRVQDDFGGTVQIIDPSKEIIQLAERTIKKLKPNPIYARVDVINNNDNQPVIMELELIEPELWFRFKEDSAKKLGVLIKEFLNKLNT